MVTARAGAASDRSCAPSEPTAAQIASPLNHTERVGVSHPLPRVATTTDAGHLARLLDAFNREFDEPSPGIEVLEGRLRVLLARESVFAVLMGAPPVGIALVTLRPNIWYDGPVALLDELYVQPYVRGRGFGTALLKATEAQAKERGARLIEINVDGEDADARRLYERQGYTCTSPGEPEPDLYYSKELQ